MRLAGELLYGEIYHRRVDLVNDRSVASLINFFTLGIQEDILAENYRLSGHLVGIGMA